MSQLTDAERVQVCVLILAGEPLPTQFKERLFTGNPKPPFAGEKVPMQKPVPHGLVKGPELLAMIWPDESSRPSIRTLERFRESRLIPFIKLGHGVWYDPDQVRAAIINKCTINARKK